MQRFTLRAPLAANSPPLAYLLASTAATVGDEPNNRLYTA
jgi:hypothetical protein